MGRGAEVLVEQGVEGGGAESSGGDRFGIGGLWR